MTGYITEWTELKLSEAFNVTKDKKNVEKYYTQFLWSRDHWKRNDMIRDALKSWHLHLESTAWNQKVKSGKQKNQKVKNGYTQKNQ